MLNFGQKNYIVVHLTTPLIMDTIAKQWKKQQQRKTELENYILIHLTLQAMTSKKKDKSVLGALSLLPHI